jgi:hypothetical protein
MVQPLTQHRLARRLVRIPRVEQTIRQLRIRRSGDPTLEPPPGSLVTSSGHGVLVRARLPAAGSSSLRRMAIAAGRRQVLIVRPRSIDRGTAAALTELAAKGVPTWVDLPHDGFAEVPVDARLWGLLTDPPATVDIDLDRYKRSVRLARNAVGETPHTTVSVLLATRRPGMVEHAIGMIGRQKAVDLQLVVGLHGDEWSEERRERITAMWPGDLVALEASSAMSLGTVLDELALRADGSLLTKWDDDDWYGPHHIGDLVRAHTTSGAQLIGKAAEFVWLEAIDETVRRPAVAARSFSDNLAGGTLMISRADLMEAGGFTDVPRSVDRVLIDNVRAQGGRVYRTHGLEFVLRRASAGDHTWDADTKYFTDDAIARRPGLDLEFADIRCGSEGNATE